MADMHQTGRLAPQSILNDRYIIVGLAGRGGMGSVYKAADTQEENRLVAIKEMSQASLTVERLGEAQERFRLEAEMLGQLSHPNLPRVIDSFAECGRSYLVMEYIDGQTLMQLLLDSPERQLPVDQVVRYAIQLCDVLTYLHQQTPAIIFRDLKPSNVMVTSDGHVYLIDFGIARMFKQGKMQDTIPLGSEGFCPPEQFGTGQTSPRSDLYSLGATLYYCLTGKNPRTNKPTLFDFAPIADYNATVPSDLDKLIQWLLATREELRPPDAAQVCRILQAIEQWTVSSTHTPTFMPKSKTLQRLQAQTTVFYDSKTARAAQSRQYLVHCNKLPGLIGIWYERMVIPFLALLFAYGSSWCTHMLMPLLRALSAYIRHMFVHGLPHYRIPARIRDAEWLITLHLVSPAHAETASAWRFRRLFAGGQEQASPTSEQHDAPPAISASPGWTPYFSVLFALLPLLVLGGSFLLSLQRYPWSFIAFCASLFCSLLTIGLYVSVVPVHNEVKHLLLLAIAGQLCSCFVLLTQPEVLHICASISLHQCFSWGVLLLVCCSLLRPPARALVLDRLAFSSTIALCALVWYEAGPQALHVVMAFPIQLSTVVTGILVGILCCAAIVVLFRSRRFNWGEGLLLCGITCAGMLLQYTFGLSEIVYIQVLFSGSRAGTANVLDLITLNMLLTLLPPAISLGCLLLSRTRRSWRLARLPVLPVAFSCVVLQLWLGSVHPPFAPSLAIFDQRLAELGNDNVLIASLLFSTALFLGFRLWKRFSWPDHGALFAVALICALIQNAAWDRAISIPPLAQNSYALLLSSSVAALNQPQFYAAACNKLIAQGLFLVVTAGLLLAASMIVFPVVRRMPRIRKLLPLKAAHLQSIQRIVRCTEHLLVLLVNCTCVLLYWFFGASTSLLAFSPGGLISVGQLLLVLLLLITPVELVRVSQPFSGVDRLIVLFDALACALLLFKGNTQVAHPVKQVVVQPWSLQLVPGLPIVFVLFCLCGMVLVSFFWLRLFKSRHIQRGVFCFSLLAFACLACYPWFGYSMLVISFIMLMQILLLSTRVAYG